MLNTKNLEQIDGFVNRHTHGLPKEMCIMKVIHKDIQGEHIYLCEWKPFDRSQYTEKYMPSEGYLGTVKVIEGRFAGIGFHAWEQNDNAFIYYQLLK